MLPAPKTTERRILAMQYGDVCWLRSLQARPDLDGHRVVLIEWVDDKQRWRCKPDGWKHTDDFIAVKPRNLANEPVPRWALLPNGGVHTKDHKVTPENTHVGCINHSDFAKCKMEVPRAPTWDTVHNHLMKTALASQGVRASPKEKAEGIESQLEKLKLDLGNQVREHTGKDADPGTYYAGRLESLMKREGELRQIAVNAGADTGGNVSMEDTLRHMLAQQALIEAQISLFALRDEPALLEQAAKMLHEHYVHLEPARKQWEQAGNPELDFWEDSENEPEIDPELQKWLNKNEWKKKITKQNEEEDEELRLSLIHI